MKAITFKTLAFLALAANVVLFSCKKKDDTPTPTTTNNTTVTDSNSLVTNMTDTIYTAAGDSGSRTFLNGGDGVIYTGTQIGQKNLGPTMVLGYDFNTDTSSKMAYYGASITDAYAFPVSYSWTNSTTITNFKTVTLDSAGFTALSQASVETTYKSSSATAASAVYKITPGQVIAFLTASGKYGVIRVIKIVTVYTGTPGSSPTSPYSTYLVFSLKMEI